MSASPETIQRAADAGWVLYETKIDGDGNFKTGMLLEATGEVLWFDGHHLEVTFK